MSRTRQTAPIFVYMGLIALAISATGVLISVLSDDSPLDASETTRFAIFGAVFLVVGRALQRKQQKTEPPSGK